ncbi:MAG: SDR family oxidoreductase [Candidatus Aenigmarchaeota archaeon]|nr:SDR family oxidoreductase [Candidatus Aenigmarchaeota archaeon]
MQTVLVTGGAGFIGSHMCDRLIRDKFRVICMDNLVTGKKENIRHLLGNKNFVYMEHDVTKPICVEEKLDHVLHLASLASPVDYRRHPIKTIKVGTLGTHNAVGLAKSNGAKFLFASTSEVYGDPEVNPQPESYWGNVNPVGIRSCYDESKRCSEALTMAYQRVHGMDTKIVRIFNTYGPRMRVNDGRVVPVFITQALDGRPLTVFGDGKQTRSFCYIDDLIEGMRRFMDTKYDHPVNLGNPSERTVLELADLVLDLTKSESKKVFKPLPEDDPKRRCPDISLANRLLKWKPKTSLRDGLAATIEYFRDPLRKS